MRVLSDGLREEMAPHNIRVTIFSPGAVKTELLDHISEADVREANQGYVGEVGVPAETLARLVAFAINEPQDVSLNESCSGRRPRRSERGGRTREEGMARIFIGSSSGLGLIAGRQLAERGHRVVLHARDAAKAEAARGGFPQVEGIVEGDLETLAGMRAVAEQVNALGRLDAVIHNAGVGERGTDRLTADGVPGSSPSTCLRPMS